MYMDEIGGCEVKKTEVCGSWWSVGWWRAALEGSRRWFKDEAYS